MEREFYYLDEKEQKGPFSIDQLKTVGLKPDTLVWTEGFENWKPVKDIEEFKVFIKKTPPPPPIIDNSPNTPINQSQDIDDYKKVLVEDSNVKFWASFKIFGISFLLIGLAMLLSYSILDNKKQKLKKEIYAKVDNILDGKTVVLDGLETLTDGVLKETNYSRLKNKNSNDQSLLFQEWWESGKLYSIYEATNGGFTIKQLTKQNDDGFDVETISSGDMGYKKPSGNYVKPQYMDGVWGDRIKISDGYYSSNFRLSVRQCYTEAFEYFTKDDRHSSGAYTPGKYVDISNFSEIGNEYFYMDNTVPKQFSTSGNFSSSWESSSNHSTNINTEDWAVYYSNYGKHYEITENETLISKDLLSYICMSVGSIIFLLVILLFAKPKYFRNLNLFGKRWQNTSYQEQIFFFEHSFFRKYTFVEMINEKVSKGVINFTDKGNTIHLSYPSKELFYKIEKISKDELVLISIKDKGNITFKRIGAKERKKVEESRRLDEIINNEETNK